MDLSIRPYEDSDLERVIEVWLRGWESARLGIHNPHDAERLRSIIPTWIEGGVLAYVAVVGASVVGFVMLRGEELGQLYVDPDYQRKGIGRKLVEFTKQISATGFSLTAIATSYDAIRFYQREGLHRTGMEIDCGSGIEVVRYEWKPQQTV
jgi:ribosomal protein S18 acetylase RimI-like enzyme